MDTNESPALERRIFMRAGLPVWPVDVRSIGQEAREVSTLAERPKGADFFIIMWTLLGTGQLNVPGKTHMLKPGWLFILPPKIPHGYRALGKPPFWAAQWFTLDGKMAGKLMAALGLNSILVRPLAGFPGATGSRIISALSRTGVPGSLDRLEACFRALHEISAQLAGKVLKYGNRFDAVMQWARNETGPQMGVQAMATQASLSRTHFSRLFTAETGMTPIDFLMEIRLSRAKELLLNTRKPVKQIAGESGFFDAAHFSRQFRKMTGLTPGRYRGQTLM